jgi:hypothetical protein
MLDLPRMVIDNLRSFNKQRPPDRRLAEHLDAVIIGPDTTFDSLDAVEFLMGLEDEIAAHFGRRIDVCRYVDRLDREVVTAAEVAACIEQLLTPNLEAVD